MNTTQQDTEQTLETNDSVNNDIKAVALMRREQTAIQAQQQQTQNIYAIKAQQEQAIFKRNLLVYGGIGALFLSTLFGFAYILIQSMPNRQSIEAINTASIMGIEAVRSKARPNIYVSCNFAWKCPSGEELIKGLEGTGYTDQPVQSASNPPGSSTIYQGVEPPTNVPSPPVVFNQEFYDKWFNYFQQLKTSDPVSFQSFDLMPYAKYQEILEAYKNNQ